MSLYLPRDPMEMEPPDAPEPQVCDFCANGEHEWPLLDVEGCDCPCHQRYDEKRSPQRSEDESCPF